MGQQAPLSLGDGTPPTTDLWTARLAPVHGETHFSVVLSRSKDSFLFSQPCLILFLHEHQFPPLIYALVQVGKAEVELDVQYGPEVTVPGQREVAHGEEVVVNCQVSANPSDVVITWTKEGDPSFQQTGQTLRLAGSNAAAENNGRYTCSATNHIQPTGKSRMENRLKESLHKHHAEPSLPGTTY